jgi:signal transduction histidine kinase/class 3 adenylate cyclase
VTLVCALISISANSQENHEKKEFAIVDSFQEKTLNEYLWVLEDKESKLQLSEISSPDIAPRFSIPNKKFHQLGFTESTYWTKLLINNKTGSTLAVNFVESYPLLDYIDFWLLDTAGNILAHHKTGDRNPPSAMQSRHHLPIFKAQIPSGQTVLITRIQSHGSMILDLKAYNGEHFHWEMASEFTIYATLISILFVMALYNFFIWLQLRHKAHIFYVLFVLSMVTQCLIISGLANFLIGWNSWILNEGVLLSSGTSIIFATIFSMHFLSLKSRHPFFFKYLIGFILLTIAAFATLPLSYQIAAKLLVLCAAILSINLIIVGSLSCLEKYRPAYFFLAAWIVLILTNIRRQAYFSGNLGESYNEWEVIAGTVFEVVLISLALADRVRLSEKKAYETVDNLNRNLEMIVDEQTKELRLKNQSLSEQKLEIEKAHQELSAVDQAKNAFFRQVSHELRTPLTLILGSLHFFDHDTSNRQEAKSISRNARRLLHLVNQLLDFQKVTQSKPDLDMTTISLKSLLTSTCDVFHDACRKRDVVLSLLDLTAKEDPLFIRGKIDSIEKIFYNYLSNALKFTNPNTQIKIIIEERNDKIRITVEDQGPGIEPDKLTELFQVYKRVESKNSSAREGTGIGLALCRELALTMSGEVGVSSRLGLGSSFWVSFPRCIQEAEVQPLMDILFVHPETSIQIEFAQKVSAATEIEHLVIVSSYEEAEKSMENHRFRCVIADLKLKGIRGCGLDVLRLACQINPHTTRIAIGDEEAVSSLHQSIDKALAHFTMIKPIHWETDLKKVEKRLSTSPIQHELSHDLEAQRERSLIHLADLEGTDELNQVKDESAENDGSSKRILLVDDLPEMRQLVKRMLSQLNMEILESENGVQAWQKLQEEPGIDLVITDWMMPAMSGPELISKIRSDKTLNALPIVLLTAKGDDASRQIGLQHGANAYLGKPFDKLELESSVLNLISLKQKEKDLLELNRRVTEDILKRYLPAALVQKVLNGDLQIDEAPKVKDVTIMFIDICDFTRNSEKLGPAKIGKMLNAFFDAMTKVIHQHGGTIDKFIGDAIMVIFGAPEVLPPYEQIQRAKDCAMAMFDALTKINDSWQELGLPTQSMRVGFHHGPAIVGSFGGSQRSDYTVIGPTVNFAARIQSAASPNSIFVSKVVRDYLDNVNLEDMGVFEMKGLPSQNLFGLSIKSNKMAA